MELIAKISLFVSGQLIQPGQKFAASEENVKRFLSLDVASIVEDNETARDTGTVESTEKPKKGK